LLVINHEKLKAFVENIGDDIEAMYYMKQVLILAYYLQKEEGVKYFEDYDIQDCYDVLEIDSPPDIDALLHTAMDEGTLVPRLNGFKFSKTGWNRLANDLKEIHEISERMYAAAEAYDLYKDVKSLISAATHEVFIVDPYVDEQVIDLYLDRLPTSVKMMILTTKTEGNFLVVARKFKLKHQSQFIVKTHDKIHDRMLFIDKRCYAIGQSLNQAASEKPTYISKLNGGKYRSTYQALFDSGKTLL
jgi:hypothetical protein